MNKQIKTLLKNVLSATVMDVGRTEPEDHDELGRWAKKGYEEWVDKDGYQSLVHDNAERISELRNGCIQLSKEEWKKFPDGAIMYQNGKKYTFNVERQTFRYLSKISEWDKGFWVECDRGDVNKRFRWNTDSSNQCDITFENVGDGWSKKRREELSKGKLIYSDEEGSSLQDGAVVELIEKDGRDIKRIGRCYVYNAANKMLVDSNNNTTTLEEVFKEQNTAQNRFLKIMSPFITKKDSIELSKEHIDELEKLKNNDSVQQYNCSQTIKFLCQENKSIDHPSDEHKDSYSKVVERLILDAFPDRENIDEETYNALSGYSKLDYHAINTVLRGQEIPKRERANFDAEKTRKQIKVISEFLDKHRLTEDTMVYRNDPLEGFTSMTDILMAYADDENLTKKTWCFNKEQTLNACVGRTFIDKGFTSTTVCQEIPKTWWSTTNNFIQEIYLPKGTPAACIAPCSQYEDEAEVLLQHGLKRICTGWRYDEGSNSYYVSFEVVLQ